MASEGARSSVGARAPARPYEDHLGTRARRREDQLAGPVGGGRLGVALGRFKQPESAPRGDLDDRGPAVLDPREARANRPAERVGDRRARRLPAEREEQYLLRSLPSVGHRAEVDRPAAGLEPAPERRRDRGGP